MRTRKQPPFINDTPATDAPTSVPTRGRILDAAELLFASHGFTGTAMRDIARSVNLNPGSLYNHFSSKQVLYEAVLERGCKVSGCTVHFVDNVYDHGPIIVQKPVEVLEDDDAHSLAARVFERELEAMPEAVNLFAEDRLRIEGLRVRILPGRSAEE